MSRIFITGDLHGHHDIAKLTSSNFNQGRELGKSDYVIIAGDFGLFFNNVQTDEEKHWLEWLENKSWTTLFLDGNHDNPNLLNNLPQKEMFGGQVGIASNSIFHLRRGNIYTIANKTFFVFGGAYSIDKQHRTEGIDWWADEEANYEEMKLGIDNLEKVNWKVDYILTHETTTSVSAILHSHHYQYRNSSRTEKYLDEIIPKIEFKHHYFGHHHMDQTVFNNHTCLYKKIKEVK